VGQADSALPAGPSGREEGGNFTKKAPSASSLWLGELGLAGRAPSCPRLSKLELLQESGRVLLPLA